MRYLRRFVAVAPAFLAGVTLLAGCGELGKLGAPTHNQPTKSFTVAGRVTAVVIDGGSGSIDVTGSGRSPVSVAQQVSYSNKVPSVTHVRHGTTLTLSYHCPVELVCGVNYSVQVPRGVAVTASATSGSVTLTGLAGTVSASAGAGLVTGVDLRSAAASFKSSAGGVIASFAVAPRSVSATTDLGPISLTVPGSVVYHVHTHALLGSATVTVRHSDSAAGHSISASSDLGSVSISAG